MLNDLLAIERGLTASGIDLVGRHPDVKDVAKGQALRVRLAEGGRVSSVEIMAEAGNGAVWTLRDGQHNGFPGLKTAAGLLALDAFAHEEHDRAWNSSKSPSDRRNELLRLFSEHSVAAGQNKNWPNSGHRKRISERLEALRTLADDPLSASVPAVFERFLAALDASPSFLEQLTSALGERVRNNGDDWLDPVRGALVGRVTLAIDVKDMEFQRDVGDARQVGAISVALSKKSIQPNTSDNGQCAFTGRHTKLHSGNFPEPNLPSQGQVKLFSKNPKIPSQSRYGLEGGASIAIAEDLLTRMAGALKSLTAQDLWNKTWRRVPGERLVIQNGKKVERWDLMIVSLPSAPDIPLAGDLAGVDDGDDDVASPESSFKELASRVTDQSRGKYEHGLPPPSGPG